eukprot:m.61471 g.61471  ORF g.61471 m.61471 type:complete len:494 (-) comp13882_c0_seq3:49-1530(-)
MEETAEAAVSRLQAELLQCKKELLLGNVVGINTSDLEGVVASYLLDGLVRFKQTIEAVASHLRHDAASNMLYHPATGYYYDHTTGLFYNSTSSTYLRFRGMQQLEQLPNDPQPSGSNPLSEHEAAYEDDTGKDDSLEELQAKKAKLTQELATINESTMTGVDEVDAVAVSTFEFDHHSYAYQQPQAPVNPMTRSRPTSLAAEELEEARTLALVLYHDKRPIATQTVSTAGLTIVAQQPLNSTSIGLDLSEILDQPLHCYIQFAPKSMASPFDLVVKEAGWPIMINDSSCDLEQELSLNSGDWIQLSEALIAEVHIHPRSGHCISCYDAWHVSSDDEVTASEAQSNHYGYTPGESFDTRRSNPNRALKQSLMATMDQTNPDYRDRAAQRRQTVGVDTEPCIAQRPLQTPQAALTQPLASNNTGFKLLSKLGWSPGSGLGKTAQGRKEPVPLTGQQGHKGLGSTIPTKPTRRQAHLEAQAQRYHNSQVKDPLAGD